MEHPSLNKSHRPAPSQSFIEGLKDIPGAADWKTQLRNIPQQHYLDPAGRPDARGDFKARLKRIPAKSKLNPMVFRMAAAAAGLGLMSLLWNPTETIDGDKPLFRVAQLSFHVPIPPLEWDGPIGRPKWPKFF